MMGDQLATKNSLLPATYPELERFAQIAARSDLVPKDYKGKPGNIVIAIQMGAELGVAPMQALQGIAVVNGRATVWGDLLWALIKSDPDCEDTSEVCDGKVATCTIKRRGQTPTVRTFSVEDAQKAGLWGKQGPWTQYPKRMLQMRARAFAARDAFPDKLRGLGVAEEVRDYTRVESTSRPVSEPPDPPATADVSYGDANPDESATNAAPEDFVIGFGKNNGKRMGELESRSLSWYRDECRDDATREAARKVIENRKACAESQGVAEYNPETGEIDDESVIDG